MDGVDKSSPTSTLPIKYLYDFFLLYIFFFLVQVSAIFYMLSEPFGVAEKKRINANLTINQGPPCNAILPAFVHSSTLKQDSHAIEK